MKITKATYEGPDSDNEIGFEIEAALENKTESTIELIKTSVIIVNSDGVTMGGSDDDEEEVYIDSGESGSFSVRSPWGLSAAAACGNLDGMKAVVDAVLFRREFHNLGEFAIPKDHKESTFVKKGIDIAGLVKIIGATCTRCKADDDGDIRVELSIGIRNISDIYFERVTANFSIFDQEGAEVDRDSNYASLAPHASKILTPSFYSLKAGRLKNCTGKLTIHVHQPIGSHSEAVPIENEKE